MKKFYLAGPMSNLPQSNFPLFDRVTAELRAMGMVIISPAELDDPATRKAAVNNQPCPHSWGELLGRDVQVVADVCDGIIFLPFWWESRGARLEAFTALLTGKTLFGYYVGSEAGINWMCADTIREKLKEFMP